MIAGINSRNPQGGQLSAGEIVRRWPPGKVIHRTESDVADCTHLDFGTAAALFGFEVPEVRLAPDQVRIFLVHPPRLVGAYRGTHLTHPKAEFRCPRYRAQVVIDERLHFPR
ncbi:MULTISPECIES: hypothetical protein [Rhodococcus]|uniref:hypothetical protein n=1 Tax=Rhodococcus TaxID=1827 RepID=UPI000EA9C672|nr:hypothetical protein [Rhodococcus opacus]NHU47165.1 hypothetical protein [Rhodococcus sp. A14]QZS55875.1 hypothetical protein FXW36_38260 [Rhodococcus opacus]RKM71063.1 hypothetical protein COO55_02695 [Rhodococcus opacus]